MLTNALMINVLVIIYKAVPGNYPGMNSYHRKNVVTLGFSVISCDMTHELLK